MSDILCHYQRVRAKIKQLPEQIRSAINFIQMSNLMIDGLPDKSSENALSETRVAKFREEICQIQNNQEFNESKSYKPIQTYLSSVMQLPLDNSTAGPATVNNTYYMIHKTSAFDNLVIKMFESLNGFELGKIYNCPEDMNLDEIFGFRNNYEDQHLTGVMVDTIIASQKFNSFIVFKNAQNIFQRGFDIKTIRNLTNIKNREKFIDNYLNFPLDLSKMAILFIVDDENSIPPNIRQDLFKFQFSWITGS